MSFLNSLQSEWLKLRRSVAAWLIVVGGLFIPTIILISRLTQYEKTLMGNASEGIWQQLYNQCWQYMSIFLLPMGITLVAGLIAQIEYRNNTWKQVFASPQSINTIFWSKYVVILTLMIGFFILFTIGVYLTGIIPALVYKDIIFPKEAFPINELIKTNFNFFIYSLPILALQYCLSLHIRNFIVPIAVGFSLLIASLIAMSWQHGYFIPYTYVSMQYLTNDNRINPTINIRAWAVGYFITITFVNYLLFLNKNQNINSVSNRKSLSITLLILTPFMTWAFFSKVSRNPKTENRKPQNTEGVIKAFEENLGFVKYKIKDKNLTGIEARMKNYDIKGLSIAVIHDYKIAWAKAYGWADAEAQIPMTTETIFQPGSISKSLNALAFMRLYQDKKIDLFEDVNHCLKSWQFPYDTTITKGKKITLAQLLSHSAGLNVHGFGIFGYPKDSVLPSTLEILRGVAPAKNEAIKSILEPGKQYKYSGGGTMLSQLVLTDFTRQTYDTHLFEHVLKPLGMTHSFFTQPPPPDKIPQLATGYTIINDGKALKNKYTSQPEQAAAGLWTTASDLANMVIHIQKALRGDKDCFLSKTTARLMLTPYNSEDASMGFFIDDKKGVKYFQHGAGNPGFSGKYIGSMEGGNGVVVLVNSDDDAPVFEEVIHTIANIYDWEGFDPNPDVEWKNNYNLPDSLKTKYVGAYKSGNSIITIQEKNKELWMHTDENVWQLHFIDYQSFINIESKTKKTFEGDKNGDITGVVFKRDNKTQTAKKIKPLFLPENQTQTYMGAYVEEYGDGAKIYWKNNNLWVDSENAIAPMSVNFIDSTTFYLKENGGIFFFEKDKNGKVIGVKTKNGRRSILRKK